MKNNLLSSVLTDNPNKAKEVLAVRVDPDIIARLDKVVSAVGKSRAKVLNSIIDFGLKDLESTLTHNEGVEDLMKEWEKFGRHVNEGERQK